MKYIFLTILALSAFFITGCETIKDGWQYIEDNFDISVEKKDLK